MIVILMTLGIWAAIDSWCMSGPKNPPVDVDDDGDDNDNDGIEGDIDNDVKNPNMLGITIWVKQARKLQATLEGCNPKLSLTHSLTRWRG